MSLDYPLAVIATRTGGCSETFIKRHMHDLFPEQTIVICSYVDPDDCCWSPMGPVLVRGSRFQYKLRRLFYQKIDPIRTRAGLTIDEFGQWQKRVAEFLLRHNVRTVLGEYLDTSHIYIKTMKKLGLRFVAHGHGYDISKLAKNPKWQKRFMEFNDAAGVVTINNISRERLAGCGIAPEKIHLIPYGVDVPPSYPGNRRTSIDENRPVRCLAVGRLVPKKAPLELLESFRLARNVFPRLQLDIVGDGPLREAVSSYIEEHGLGAHVALHGRKPNEYARELFSSVDIFLQHSITDPRTGDEEGLPVAILEAMAHGLPVISTRHAGIPDEVVDNVNGYLVEENDVQTMADRIVTMSAEYKLRARMGEAGWRRAAEKFSWKGERRELLKVLDLD